MLVLTRRKGDGIIITTPSGEVIKVVMVSVGKRKNQVGIIADRSVTVVRDDANHTGDTSDESGVADSAE